MIKENKMYRCIESFTVPLCDDDGRDEEEILTIEKGSEWIDKGDAYVVLDSDGIHLETNSGSWLEIPKDLLFQCFEKIP